MDARGFQSVAEGRLSQVADDGAADKVAWMHGILDAIRDLADEYKSALPSRDVFLAGLGAAMDRLFAGIDTPGPDMIVEPMIKAAVLILAGRMYDQLVTA